MDVVLPPLDDEDAQGVVTAWLVDEGSHVTQDQLIAEAQSEKVSFDIVAPADGMVVDLVAINQPIDQGGAICRVRTGAESETPPSHGAGDDDDSHDHPDTNMADAAGHDQDASEDATAGPTRIPASPAARRLARELDVALSGLTGSGPSGRITKSDVQAAHEAAKTSGFTGLRAVIARNMRTSHAETAPVTLTSTVDVTDRLPDHVTARMVKATAIALADHLDINGRRDGDAYHPSREVNIAVAIQTDAGLVAPVVADPGSQDLDSVSGRIADLAQRARDQRLEPADYEDATFTVTNLGTRGIDAFTPIINLPQIAVLGIGAVRSTVVMHDGQPVGRDHMTLSLTFDHAFVDGAPAADFLARIREVLETEPLA